MKVETLIIGGRIIGSAVVYFLAQRAGGQGVYVLEPDPTYGRAATTLSASAIRTQFNLGINVPCPWTATFSSSAPPNT